MHKETIGALDIKTSRHGFKAACASYTDLQSISIDDSRRASDYLTGKGWVGLSHGCHKQPSGQSMSEQCLLGQSQLELRGTAD